jgi:hypothetical protein
MIKYLLALFLFTSLQLFSQIDKHGNPIFNSIATGEETIGDFQLLSNYYTLKNNLENKGSSVYISENPTLDEIEYAAQNLPSDFFLIVRDKSILSMVMLLNKPTKQYFVVNPTTGEQQLFSCSIEGDISENRANEIVDGKYDSKAKIKGNVLHFNKKKLKIISNKDINEGIKKLIQQKKLTIVDSENFKILTKEDLREIVLRESKEGGKFDFFTEIKEKEFDAVQIKPGVFTTNLSVALYKWGRANYELGTNTLEEAMEFWKEIKDREPNEREAEYIKMGYNKEWEN